MSEKDEIQKSAREWHSMQGENIREESRRKQVLADLHRQIGDLRAVVKQQDKMMEHYRFIIDHMKGEE